jgi:hypothetical protein
LAQHISAALIKFSGRAGEKIDGIQRKPLTLRLSKHALSFAEGGERALGRPLLEGRYNQKVWK